MKEDVLEQLVDDFLQLDGYFTTHNIAFRPDKAHEEYDGRKDSVASDIDVLGYNPRLTGADRVLAVSCKAWQAGFDPRSKLRELQNDLPAKNRRKTWHHFRELWSEKWATAFHEQVYNRTGEPAFTYCIAVTRLNGPLDADEAARLWMDEPRIRDNLNGCPFRFLTLEHMWNTVLERTTTRPAPSDMGRLAQLLRAARLFAE